MAEDSTADTAVTTTDVDAGPPMDTQALADTTVAPPLTDANGDSRGDTARDTERDTSTAPVDTAPAGTRTVLRVHYPRQVNPVGLRGDAAGLSWERGQTMTFVGEDTYEYVTTALDRPLEWKPLLGDRTWARGPNYRARPGQTVDVYPHFERTAGSVSRRWTAFRSTILGNTRGVWVYLPPTHLENPTARFPVVYFHDGQNLFDPRTAFGGVTWRVAEALDTGAEDGSIREVIAVGVENTPARINEYTPTRDAARDAGGDGERYLRMLVEELMPLVNRELPTLTGPERTALVGSSLGGLISAYGGVRRPETFGLIGALSPSTWWDNRMLLREVASVPSRPARALRVYVDSGDSGPSMDDVVNTRALALAYRAAGYTDGDFRHVVQAGATHTEAAWASRLPGALAFLLGPR
ncbi:MAG: alpha/beta hydrolase [Deltaproteobacteria bacterium]|nr:alpha/beta hydrolase [Deltaproteobacteria bacterium]